MAVNRHSGDIEAEVITEDVLKARYDFLGANLAGLSMAGRNVIHLSRLYEREHLDSFITAAHERGSWVVFDTDDDLTDDFRQLGRGDEFKLAMRSMDHVTVSTPHLAERMEQHIGYRPTVISNHIDYSWFSEVSLSAKKMHPGLVIGLIGTASHYDDWVYPMEAFKKIAEKYENVTILVAGFHPEYLDDLPNVKKMNGVAYQHYPALVRQFDVVCCSLDPDDMFNKSKSAIKAIEAMAAVRRLPDGERGGAIPVCTDMSVYRRVVAHRGQGLLTSNDRWYETLSELIENRKLCRSLSVRGAKWVAKNRDFNRTGWKHWAKLFREVKRTGGKNVH
jgi:hypothetical protein